MARGATGLGAVLSQDSETPPRTRTGLVGIALFALACVSAAAWAASLAIEGTPEELIARWAGHRIVKIDVGKRCTRRI